MTLGRLSSRSTALVALTAAAFLLADAVMIFVIGPRDLAFDFTCCYQQAAERALDAPSTLYAWSDTYMFRYTPIGALLFAPLVPLSESAASWAWLGFKALALIGAAAWFARAWPAERRWLVALLVVSFPPIVHDLVIGNVSTLTFLVLLALARWRSGLGGIALGVLTVLMPKPHLIPVLAYLAIRRPRDFLAAVGTMSVGVLIGLALFRLDPWIAFIGTLREPLERTFTANVGFSGLLGPPGVVIGLIFGAVIWVAGVALGGSRGFGLSIIGAIAMGPYTFIHYLAGALVAVEPVLRSRPRRLAPFAWLLVVFPLIPVWLTALGWVVRTSPPPSGEAEAPPAATPG